MKIVSLLPSATEIVCRLGLESSLVGVSHECDYPAPVTHLPRLTASKINPRKSSSEIHRSVAELLKSAISVYDLNLDLFRSLQPDWVITQDLCDVCAVSFQQVEDACRQVCEKDTKIISLRPNKLNDIWQDVARVAESLGVRNRYEDFQRDVDRRIEDIQTRLRSAPAKKKILTIEWLDPVMIGGMWIPEMIEIAGGEVLLAESGQPASTVGEEQLRAIDPDVVIVKPCGFKLEQTLREMAGEKFSIPWEGWKACRTKNIFLVDGNTYFNRPGPRIIDSLEILAGCAHPDLFPEFTEKYKSSIRRMDS